MQFHQQPFPAMLYAVLACAGACLHGTARAAGTPAGTAITNTATATYSMPGGDEMVTSNAVTLEVDEVLDVTVATEESGDVPASPNAVNQVLKYRLTNGGNGNEAFALTTAPSAGNDFAPTVTALVLDTNGNGGYDAGVDTVYVAGSNDPALPPDQSVTVFVLATIPAGAANGERGGIQLVAASRTGTGLPGTTFAGQGDGGVNALVGVTGADGQDDAFFKITAATVSLVKSASVADPFGGTAASPGAIITYSLAAAANGSGTVANVRVADSIPAGTTYQAGSLRLDGAVLTDAADGDAGSFAANNIAVGLGGVPAGTTKTVTFQVKID